MKTRRAAEVIFSFCLIAGLIIGCVTTPTPFPTQVPSSLRFAVTIDSIAASDAHLKGKTYIISSAIKDVKDDDLQFKEFARYIENALSQKGYMRVDSDKKADLLIRLSYGLGTPQTTTSTYTTSYGYSYPIGWMWYHVPPTTQTQQITHNTVSFQLEAYGLKTPSQQPQLWKTTVKSNTRVPNNIEGGIFVVTYYDISDLRIQIPYMIAASSYSFGGNTGRAIDVTILGGDPTVFAIMK
jgi:hypothetical protein